MGGKGRLPGCRLLLAAAGLPTLCTPARRPAAHTPASPRPPHVRLQAGAGISPLGSVAMVTTAALDLVLPKCGVKAWAAPVWGAGERSAVARRAAARLGRRRCPLLCLLPVASAAPCGLGC